MYADPLSLDNPPPVSHFRRPWSPNQLGSSNLQFNDHYWDQNSTPEHPRYHRRPREPSDVSVEALDLADYAKTLHARQRTNDRYPPFPSHSSNLNTLASPPPPPATPLLPSLVSRGGTLSTQSHTHSPTSRTPYRHRPFSLPPPPPVRPIPYPDRSLIDPSRVAYSDATSHLEPEIDVSQFPSWSRGWYDSKNTKNVSPYTQDDCPPFLRPHVHSSHRHSPFGNDYPTYGDPPSSTGHSHPSHAPNALWAADRPDHLGSPLDPETREERIRMLQREFGSGKGANLNSNDGTDEDRIIGSVDAKGKLITEGPRKRVAVRVLQLILALAAAGPSIYAAVLIKSNAPPPPAARPAAYALYILSIATMLALSYLVVIRPCCGARTKTVATSDTGPLAGGMMVLPVHSLPGGGKQKKGGKKRRKGAQGAPPGDVQVNLIVDPTAFGMGQELDDESDDETADAFGEGSMPGGYGSGHRSRKRRRATRRSLFRGLEMEGQWKLARSSLRKLFFFDLAAVIIWGAEFVFILYGKRCPSGTFNGWCNAYNVSSAAACLLCIAFGANVFFDIKDLHASKLSPRTRT